jgi:hypothetical protein
MEPTRGPVVVWAPSWAGGVAMRLVDEGDRTRSEIWRDGAWVAGGSVADVLGGGAPLTPDELSRVGIPSDGALVPNARENAAITVVGAVRVGSNILRLVELSDGSARVERWTASAWEPEGGTVSDFMLNPSIDLGSLPA